MINIHTWKDKIIMLNKKYPVYGTNDRVIGYTAVGDKAVITYQDENMDYFETILISGKYTGVNTLALDKKDMESSTLVIDKAFSYQQYFFNNKEIKTYYENDYDDAEIDYFDALKDILDNSDSDYLKDNKINFDIKVEELHMIYSYSKNSMQDLSYYNGNCGLTFQDSYETVERRHPEYFEDLGFFTRIAEKWEMIQASLEQGIITRISHQNDLKQDEINRYKRNIENYKKLSNEGNTKVKDNKQKNLYEVDR